MKTKIGLSAGAYAAFTWLLALYGGYIPLVIAVGYVLIFETNEWLRVSVVKALFFTLVLSLLCSALYILPDLFEMFDDWAGVFNGNVPYGKLSKVIAALVDIVTIFKTVFFIILGLMALKMKTIRIGFIDKFAEKHLSMGQQ